MERETGIGALYAEFFAALHGLISAINSDNYSRHRVDPLGVPPPGRTPGSARDRSRRGVHPMPTTDNLGGTDSDRPARVTRPGARRRRSAGRADDPDRPEARRLRVLRVLLARHPRRLPGLAGDRGGFLLPDWRVNNRYSSNSCLVLDRKLDSRMFDMAGPAGQRARKEESYRPAIKIRYEVNGRKIETWAYDGTGNLLPDRAAQQAIVDSFQVGSTCPCWYDPDRPDQAVLVRGHSWGAYVFLILPVALLAVGGLGIALARTIATSTAGAGRPGRRPARGPEVPRLVRALQSLAASPRRIRPLAARRSPRHEDRMVSHEGGRQELPDPQVGRGRPRPAGIPGDGAGHLVRPPLPPRRGGGTPGSARKHRLRHCVRTDRYEHV